METSDPAINVENPCQACGACCSYSSNWPRFTTEDDAALDLIPEKFVNEKLSGMRCEGDRCSALSGKVGVATSCGIYAVRPEVCRTCMPGDPECGMARKRHGDLATSRPGERRATCLAHAVTACARSSSSNSSSTDEKVLSGLVESVIGLRLP